MTVNNDRRMEEERTEEALRNALCRRPAPEGFADRVLARVAEGRLADPRLAESGFAEESLIRPIGRHRVPWLRIFAVPVVRWAAAVVICVALVVGGLYHRNVQRERAQGEAAKRQLILALRIAGSKLQLAKSKINQINTNRVLTDQTESHEEKE